MSRSYYGLSRVGGIADGFGVGLTAARGFIQDKRDAEYQQAKLDADAEAARLTADFRSKQLDNEATRIRLQGEENAAAEQFRADQRAADSAESIAAAEARKAEAEANAATRRITEEAAAKATAVAEGQLDAQAREQKNTAALESIAQLDLLIKRAQQTGTQPDLEMINTLIGNTADTKFDLSTILGADYQNDIANLTSVIREQLSSGQMLDTSDPRILAGADALVNANGGTMIGRTVDSTFVNAPKEYQDGNYRVVSREATGIDIKEGADGLMFSSDVLVTLERKDAPGEFYHYIAPMTDGRVAGSTQRAQVPINQIIDGMGGTAILIDTLNRDMAPVVRAAKIDQMGGDSAFRSAVNSEIESMVSVMEASPGSRTYMGSKTNEELLQSPDDIRRIAEDRALGLGRKTERFGDQAKQTALQARAIVETELQAFKVEGPDGRPTKTMDLTQQEVFRLAATLENGEPGKETRELLREIADKKGAIEIKRSVFGRNSGRGRAGS